ncbi:MAG TPA: winged helix-turn-helix domain-containing protein [Candidatus Paceibacterota bacterium]
MGAQILAKKHFAKRKAPKTPKQMERHLKGIANHYRIAMLLLVAKNAGITVEDIVEALGGNYTNLSIHISKLVQAGLLEKRYKGRNVTHYLTPYGTTVIAFLKTFQHL